LDRPFLRRFMRNVITAAGKAESGRKRPAIVVKEAKDAEEARPSKPSKLLIHSIPPPVVMKPITRMRLSRPETQEHQEHYSGWGKLDDLLNDPQIRIIECDGPGKPLKVRRGDEVITTGLELNEEEIMEIINKFPRLTGAPLNQTFKARLGSISITAFISPVIGTTFMLIKG